jgi:hypothetical protein
MGIVAKTPPDRAVLVATGADETWVAAFVVAGAAAAAEDPPPATAAQPVPVGFARAEEVARPSCSTESPGAGKITSVESTVPQPLPMFAVNMLGKALKAV